MRERITKQIILFIKYFFAICFIIFQVISLCLAQQRKIDNRTIQFLSSPEKDVLNEINLARQNPKKYASFIEQLKPYYVGKFIRRPDQLTIMTEEGVSAVDEAIRFLKSAKPIAPLKYSNGLSKAAMDHVKDQGQNGTLDHRGSDGSQPGDRVNRYGTWCWTVGENISCGRDNARDIVIGLIINDGVPSRGHRDNIFNSRYRFAGVACGHHKTFGTICVITFAGEFVENEKYEY